MEHPERTRAAPARPAASEGGPAPHSALSGADPGRPAGEPLRVVVSLDVEEEGLFSGRYPAAGCTVRNVDLLPRLAPISRELGFPLTLLCAHAVFADPRARAVLLRMRDELGAEIGAHLHHWSTPPLPAPEDAADAAEGIADGAGRPAFGDPAQDPGQAPRRGPQRTDRLPRELLRARLSSLLRAGRECTGAPLTSFRMGRWDLKSVVRPLLAEEGILVDSSVCPLRVFPDGPDHFLAPADPYWVDLPGGGRLLEAPITQLPLHPALSRLWHGAGGLLPESSRQKFLDGFHFWGALSANPVWHHPRVMRWAAQRHVARGGRVLGLFWHSSEMLPGASPNIPDQAAADALIERVRDFLIWLRGHCPVRGVTLSSLRDDPLAAAFPARPDGPGDW